MTFEELVPLDQFPLRAKTTFNLPDTEKETREEIKVYSQKPGDAEEQDTSSLVSIFDKNGLVLFQMLVVKKIDDDMRVYFSVGENNFEESLDEKDDEKNEENLEKILGPTNFAFFDNPSHLEMKWEQF